MKLILVVAAATLTVAQTQSIVARDLSSWGGFALLANPCPNGTSTCGKASCCPSSYTCSTTDDSGVPVCCPSSADCYSTVTALNSCADNSWNLYSFGGSFCCTSDTVGTFSSAGTQCIAKNLPIPSSITLTTISQATGSAAATISGGTSVTGGAASHTTTGVGSSSSTTPPSSNSSQSKISEGAIIAIAVLAVIVALLAAFIVWRFCTRRSKPAPPLPVSAVPPAVVEPATGTSPSPWVYKTPTPMGQELPGNVAQAPVYQQGPIYEADPAQRVELDAH